MKSFFPKNFKRLPLDLCILLFAALIIVLPILLKGIPTGADTPQHYQFAITFYDSIQNGNFYPGWASLTNHGFGDVGIRFYPPFAYYVMAAFRFLTGNWYDASVLTFIFWFFLGGVGIYFWCREWFGESASLMAAVVYIFMPYHTNQIYNAFMYGEFAGSAILPFCFLFITRLCRTGKTINCIGLAFFYTLLVLTHLPLSVMGSISLLLYSLASLEKGKITSTLLKLSASVFLGLSASSFYWLKMVTELDFVKHTNAEFTSSLYNFHQNFIFLSAHSIANNFFAVSSLHCDLLLSITLAMIVPSVVLFYLRAKNNLTTKLFNVGLVLIFSIFIATPNSIFIWENFSILQKIQFPWRWLAVVSMTSAIFIAAGFDILLRLFFTPKRSLALLTYGLIAAGIIFTFTGVVGHSLQMPRQEFAEQIRHLPDSASYACWLPTWANETAFALPQQAMPADRALQLIVWQATKKEIIFSAGKPTDARIAVFYYPHWKATVNGQPTELKSAADGTIQVPLPSEQADVKIWFQEPLPNQIAKYISALTWLLLGLFGLFYIFQKRMLNIFYLRNIEN